jgi:restriction system protein
MPLMEFPLSLTPHLPTYSEARAFLKVLQGVSYGAYRSMVDCIDEQKGSPQENTDWSDPVKWIPERLKGGDQELAFKIWHQTQGLLNPRHSRGCWYFVCKHDLISRADEDRFAITPAGQEFIADPECKQVVMADQTEGLFNLLQVVSEHSLGRRGDILPGYALFCKEFTRYQSLAVHKSSLWDRLKNLVERGFVKHSDQLYEITQKGSHWLEKNSDRVIGRTITVPQTKLQELVNTIKKEARQQLSAHLATMNPYKFEHLIKLLLEEMGYDNVEVTAPSNDKGVDVVADIELGISSIREVVQVKRHAGTINRPVLDQLRGTLFRFKALRGTIITTGKFAAGAKKAALEQGGAPLTLIDGEKLIDLLIQYEIGMASREIKFYEFDDSRLKQFADQPGALEEQEE